METKAPNLWRIFLEALAKYPFRSFRFFVGNFFVGIAQVVSIGSLYPIIAAVIEQNSQSGRLIKYFDKVLYIFGCEPVLMSYLFLFIGIASLSAGIFVAVGIDQGRFLKVMEIELRQSIVKTVVGSRWQELRNLNHGEFINVVTREAELYKVLVKNIFLIIGTLIQLAFFSYFIFRINLKFAVISFILLCLGFFVFMPLMKIASRLGHEWTDAFGRLTSNLVNSSRAFKNIKAGSLEKFLLRYFKPIVYETSHVYYKQQVLSAVQVRSIELFGYCALSLLIYIGIEVMTINATQLVIALVILSKIIPKARSLSDYFHRAYGNLPSLIKIQKIKEECMPEKAKKKEEARKKRFTNPMKVIHFQDVGFQHDSTGKLFDSLTAEFHKGEFWAICGATGSGKTTILDLISGIIDPSFGDIFYDGINSRKVSLDSLHQRIGYLTQDSFMFAASILENICWGHENPDLSKIDQVIQMSQLNDLIREKTLDFPVSESGQNLSGGEQQRVVIARLLLKSYDFILMDEPSSALDSETEQRFLSALVSLKKKVGVIMVTHRQEYLKHADHILRFNGSNVEIIPTNVVKPVLVTKES
ncbi:ATP-binding cassette domain-containing protein [Candidatus Omnitrophota bacterium]